MRRAAQQNFALLKRMAHQGKIVVLQITQAAMDEFGAGRRSMLGKVVFLAQDNLQTTTGSIPCDAAAIDTAANH